MPDEFTPEESAYFESGGNTDLPETQTEPAQEAAPEQEAQPVPEPKQESTKPPEGYVPYDALHAERQMRKQLQSDLDSYRAETEARLGNLDTLREQIEAIRAEKRQQQAEEDPFAHLETQNREMRDELNELKTYREQQQFDQQQMQELQQVVNRYQSDMQSFAQQHKEFPAAINFLADSRRAELRAMGFSRERIEQELQAEEWRIIDSAYSNDANPAERIYELAKLRGYKPNTDIDAVKKGLEEAAPAVSQSSSSEAPDLVKQLIDAEGDEFDKIWKQLYG